MSISYLSSWFLVSDNEVYPVEVDAVLNSVAYMLFYEKIDLGYEELE
jgi:hypothetical protein